MDDERVHVIYHQVIEAYLDYDVNVNADRDRRIYQLTAEKDDIRIADILFAIQHSKNKKGYMLMGSDGGFYRATIEWDEKDLSKPGLWNFEGIGGLGVGWNFMKDSLTEQFDETIEFLYQLLK